MGANRRIRASRSHGWRRPGGFTLVEMMVAMTIMILIVGGIFAVFNPSQGSYRTQSEVSDLQQRLRLAVAGITDAIRMAGAGTYRGTVTGPLSNILAPVLPYRVGNTSSDPASGTFFRTNVITTLYVPADAADTSLAAAQASSASDLQIATDAGCPPSAAACGFSVGDRAVVFDDGGGFDLITVTGISGGNTLQHVPGTLSKAYTAGSRVVEIAMDTLYLRSIPSSSTYELMHYDGYQSDETLVDNVVDLRFDYLGDPTGPALIVSPAVAVGPWTTYGPKPPVVGVDNASDNWPAGQNCVFTVTSGQQVPRLSSLGSGSLVALTQTQLTDGPWCPDSASPNRFDADLLRIRTVRVMVRLQTGDTSLRGSSATLFSKPGAAKESGRVVPDQEIRFDVSPRNVSLNR